MKLSSLELMAAKNIIKILEPCSNEEALNILNKVMMAQINKERKKYENQETASI